VKANLTFFIQNPIHTALQYAAKSEEAHENFRLPGKQVLEGGGSLAPYEKQAKMPNCILRTEMSMRKQVILCTLSSICYV
jgi:hypothetical protein